MKLPVLSLRPKRAQPQVKEITFVVDPDSFHVMESVIVDGQGNVNDLTFSKKRIAQDVKKALNSAIANAENNHNLDVDRLIVAEASVGKGLVMKRFQTRGRGRAAGIIKPFSHLTIVVRERAEAEDK